MLGDQRPVLDGCPAQRVGADPHAGALDRLDVDDVLEVAHVASRKSYSPSASPSMSAKRVARDALQAAGDQLVGAVGDPAGRVGVGRAAVRRVVLEAAVARRVVARGDDDAVRAARDRRARRPRLYARIAWLSAGVGTQESRESTRTSTPFATSTSMALRSAGSDSPCVSRPEEQRTADALGLAVVDDRLGGREDVVLVEAGAQRRSAVAAGAERDALLGDGGIRLSVVVGGDQLVDVDQVGCFGGCPARCSWVPVWHRRRDLAPVPFPARRHRDGETAGATRWLDARLQSRWAG